MPIIETLIAISHGYIKPTGALISIFIVAFLLHSLVQSFIAFSREKKRKTTPLQITAIITCIVYILYLIGLVLTRWAFKVESCSFRLPMLGVLYTMTRLALYLFLLLRAEVSFAGSAYAFNPMFIKVLEVFMVLTYIAYAICHMTTGHLIVFDPERQICIPNEEGRRVIFGFTYPFLAIDFLLGVVICGSFARRLWQLQHEISDKLANQSNNDDSINFVRVAKKQTKLAFVAYITSLLVLYIMPATKFFSFPFLDALINTMCVYCTFRFVGPKKMYRICCECNGNKICLCMWCFCCWCCNVPPREVTFDAPAKDLKKVASNDPMSSEDDTTKQSGVDVVSGETTVDTTEDATATAPTITATPATAST
eukprot:443767_1